jgi:hypothetical protein
MSLKGATTLDELLGPVSQCLTPESARRLLKVRATTKQRARVERLAQKSTDGTLTTEEQAEYNSYLSFASFVALLKSKARLLLTEADHD